MESVGARSEVRRRPAPTFTSVPSVSEFGSWANQAGRHRRTPRHSETARRGERRKTTAPQGAGEGAGPGLVALGVGPKAAIPTEQHLPLAGQAPGPQPIYAGIKGKGGALPVKGLELPRGHSFPPRRQQAPPALKIQPPRTSQRAPKRAASCLKHQAGPITSRARALGARPRVTPQRRPR